MKNRKIVMQKGLKDLQFEASVVYIRRESEMRDILFRNLTGLRIAFFITISDREDVEAIRKRFQYRNFNHNQQKGRSCERPFLFISADFVLSVKWALPLSRKHDWGHVHFISRNDFRNQHTVRSVTGNRVIRFAFAKPCGKDLFA